MGRKIYSLVFMLTVMSNMVFGQYGLVLPGNFTLCSNTNTTKDVYAREQGKDMTFLGIPIKGSSLQLYNKLNSVKFKSVIINKGKPNAILTNRGSFLGVDGWSLFIRSTNLKKGQYTSNDTVYRVIVEKIIYDDSARVYFDRAKSYIDKTYPYFTMSTYYNNWNNEIGRMIFFTAYGYINVEYSSLLNSFKISFENARIVESLKESAFTLNIYGFPDNFKNNCVTIYYDPDNYYAKITADIDNVLLKIIPIWQDMSIFSNLFSEDSKKLNLNAMKSYLKVIIEKNINRPHNDYCGLISQTDVFDYCKELRAKEKQAALDRKKREDFMFEILKFIGSNRSNDYETTIDYAKRRGIWY